MMSFLTMIAFFLYRNSDHKPNKNIYNCRYNFETKAIYCEFKETVYSHTEMSEVKYRLKLDSDKIEGKCSLKAGQKFKSATLQTYNKDKKQWGNICLIASYYYKLEMGAVYDFDNFATNYGQQRFILKTKNCQITFYYHKKIYVTRVF